MFDNLKKAFSDVSKGFSEKELKEINIEWKNAKSLCVVLCSNGYPDAFKKNIQINNLNNIKLNLDNYMFHAGTIKKNEKILAVGGRVLNFVSLSNDFKLAKKNVEENLTKLNWTGGFFRKDIGHKVIE